MYRTIGLDLGDQGFLKDFTVDRDRAGVVEMRLELRKLFTEFGEQLSDVLRLDLEVGDAAGIKLQIADKGLALYRASRTHKNKFVWESISPFEQALRLALGEPVHFQPRSLGQMIALGYLPMDHVDPFRPDESSASDDAVFDIDF